CWPRLPMTVRSTSTLRTANWGSAAGSAATRWAIQGGAASSGRPGTSSSAGLATESATPVRWYWGWERSADVAARVQRLDRCLGRDDRADGLRCRDGGLKA